VRRLATCNPRPLLVALLLLYSAPARAEVESCGQNDNTWVNVRFLGHGWSKKTADAVMAELRTDMAKDGIAICAEVPSALLPPVAVVELSADEPGAVVISIQVRDKVTAKRVGRDTDVSALPADGRPLALAAAADELLRVTWAELALQNARPPATVPPVPVLRAARATVGVPTQSGAAPAQSGAPPQVGARFALQRFTAGQTLVGGDGFVRVPILSRLELELAAGARAGLRTEAPHGKIRSHALSASAALLGQLLTRARWQLSAGAGLQVASVTFDADADGEHTASSANAVVVAPYVFAAGSVKLISMLRLGAELGVGAPVRGAVATDDSAQATGVSGLMVVGAATIGVNL
jgi:hypothetical protein